MLSRINKYPVPFVILALLLVEFIINPIGEFPLNDDWAYSKTILNYLHTNSIKLNDWQAVPLVPQLFLGILVTKTFGFSFTALRFISIVSLTITIVFFNKILSFFNFSAQKKLIALSLFAFNPLTISLCNTFLPDVFTLFLVVLATYYLIRILQEYTHLHYILFCLFAFLATLNRQTSIVLPIAFAILYIIKKTISVKTTVMAVLPTAVCIGSLIGFPILCKHLGTLPLNYQLQLPHIVNSIIHPSLNTIKSTIYYLVTSTLLLGLFMLPLTLANYKEHLITLKESILFKTILFIYIVIICIKLFIFHNYLPFVGNMFYPYGVGPIIMTGIETQYILPVSTIAKILWALLNILGALSFSCVINLILTKLRNNIASPLLLILFISYLTPLCFSYVNDRYLLLLLPFFVLAYLQSTDFKASRVLITCGITACIIISTATTHDYLSLNRARWQATYELVNTQHISPTNIDGGFEVNGWYSDGFKNYNPLHTGRWWWVNNDTYVISPMPLNGYSIQESIPLNSCISFRFQNLYILKRN